MGSSGHHPPELFEMGWDGFCSEIPLPPHKKVWDGCTLWGHHKAFGDNLGFTRSPPGYWNFSKGVTESRGRQKDLLKNAQQEQISAMGSGKILDVSREIPPKKVFLLCRWLIQSCSLSLSSHSVLLCSLRFPDEHHPSSHDTASGRKYGIVSFSGKWGKLANSLSKEENCNSLANLGLLLLKQSRTNNQTTAITNPSWYIFFSSVLLLLYFHCFFLSIKIPEIFAQSTFFWKENLLSKKAGSVLKTIIKIIRN